MQLLPVVVALAGFMRVSAEVANRSTVAELRSKILSRADPFLPPVGDGTTPVPVQISFLTKSIVQVNTAEEAMTVVLVLIIQWQDTNLAWEDEDYKDVGQVVVPSFMVWSPRLIISNSLDPFALLIRDNEVVIQSNGNSTVEVLDVYRLKCKLLMDRYPYDQQSCRVDLENLLSFQTNITATLLNSTIDHGEWTRIDEYVSTDTDRHKAKTFLHYYINIQRVNEFYSLQVVFPMTLMSMLHALVFLVPAETGEKCGYLMAVFVSHFMFQNLIYTSLPRSSVSRLSVFSVLILVQGVVAIVATVLSLHRHHKAAAIPDPQQGQGRQAWVKDSVKVHPEGQNEDEGVGRRVGDGSKKCLHWSDYALCVVFLVISIICPFVLFV